MATVTSTKRHLDVTSDTYQSNGNVVIGGDLTVNGSTTTLDTQNLIVEDKNIIIGQVSTPSDTTADGGGITLKGATDKTIYWSNSDDEWKFNQGIEITSGIITVSGGTSTQWNTAYSWGDHSGLYAAASHTHAASDITSGTFADARIALTNITQHTDPKYLRSNAADTATGTITFSGGINGFTSSAGISGNNYNITGVNQLSINDPGEGIVFGGGSSGNITLAVVDDTSDNILRLSGTNAELQVGTNRVLTTADEGSGNGLDADTLDGNHASAFALSSHNHDSDYVNVTGDTMTGTLDVHVGDSGTILKSGNASATGTPDQFFIKHNFGNVEIGNNRGNINITNGNVGIGTTSPAASLHVAGTTIFEGGAANWGENTQGTSTGTIHIDPGVSTDNFGGAITFGASDSGSGATAQAGIYTRTDGNYGTKMYIATTNNYTTGAQTAISIMHNGRVGIGNSNPSQELHVTGNVKVTGAYYDSTNSAGTSGQVLSSTATGTDWITLNDIYYTETEADNRFVNVTGDTMTGQLLMDNAQIIIDMDAAGAALTWRESDSTTVAGQLRAYVNRGDLYLYENGVHTAEITAATGSFVPDLTITNDLTVSGGDITLGGTGRIQGIDTVSAGTDAANKTYVDNAVSGFVDGSGTANYIPKWSDSDTLTDSIIYASSSYVGIGTATPSAVLEVFGGNAIIDYMTAGRGYGTGLTNTSFGYQVYGSASGSNLDNTVFGYRTLYAANGAVRNTAIGKEALRSLTSGDDNTAVGSQANYSLTTGVSNVAIGQTAGFSNTGGAYNVAIGRSAGYGNLSSSCIAIGYNSLQAANSASGTIAIGVQALQDQTSGAYNIGIGYSALANNTTGIANLAVGYNALTSNVSGGYNLAFGAFALQNCTGDYNFGIGYQSLNTVTTGVRNTGFGFRTLRYATGDRNVAIGFQTADAMTTGNDNVAIGTEALGNFTTGSNNVGVGYLAGGSHVTNSNSVYVGYNARGSANGNTNEIAIGYNALGNGSNTTTIGNNSTTKTIIPAGDVGIGITSPTTTLDVNGITTSKGFQTNTANTDYNLMSRNNAGNATLYVQSATSDTNQPIAQFNYGSASANNGTQVLKVAKDESYFINTDLGIGTSTPAYPLDVTGNVRLTGDLYVDGGQVYTNNVQARVKYSVWTDTTYGIGMQSGYSYGHLTNDYAMTFQMNNDDDRGFWWGDNSHTNSQGAMSLTTQGKATIARSLSVGEGETITSPSDKTLHVEGETETTNLSYPYPTATDQYHGEIVTFGTFYTTNGTIAAGDVIVYTQAGLNTGWYRAQGNGTYGIGMLGVAMGTTPSAGILIKGFARNVAFTGTIPGGPLYLSPTSAGDTTNTVPSSTNNVVRIVGYMLNPTNDEIFFDPDKSWVQVS